MWKGGKTTVNGYTQIKYPEHQRANNQGYVFEHVLVMEKILGRLLTRDEIVHHCNEKRSDNRPENLWLFPSLGDHTRYHKSGNIRMRAML